MKNKVQRHFPYLKKNKLLLLGAITVLVCSSNALAQNNGNKLVSDNFDFAKRQMVHMLENIPQGEAKMPHSINGKGNTSCRSIYWWTSGFFPGILWYINEYTGDKAFESFAKKWTEKLEPVKTFKGNHDIGFMMYCSFGNAYRLTQNEKYKDILIQSAYSLATRFNPQVGTIKSWDSWRSWENKHVFKYPVIIDNMMNLELLFWASKATGDPSFRNIAISHAEKTMKYQIRKDGSSYHLACYDPETGNFIKGETSQGYSNESTWSRGQGWGIYGFTLCYRETKDPRFLKTAQRIIVELKDKIAVTGIESAATVKSVAVAANTEIYEEAVAALTMLGFAQAPSQKVTAQILKEEPDAPVEKVIKLALKRL